MLVLGLDFTSAPTSKKPITCARGTFSDSTLTIERLDRCTDFAAFERVLSHPGPYIAGIDFPFSQPGELVAHCKWPRNWQHLVAHVASLKKAGFESQVRDFDASQEAGKKRPLRRVDRLAGGCSPVQLDYVPVGKMFFEGAPRLLSSGASIIPCCPRESKRLIVEAYPAVAVRTLLRVAKSVKTSYKSDDKGKQTPEKQEARREIIARLGHPDGSSRLYGLSIELPVPLMSTMLLDPTGDTLDAVLCALQAAWAHTRRDDGFGIPHDADPNEGWIPDPGLLAMG